MVSGHCQLFVSISGAVCLKKEGKRWRMNLMKTSITGENSDGIDAPIRENSISSQSVAQ